MSKNNVFADFMNKRFSPIFFILGMVYFLSIILTTCLAESFWEVWPFACAGGVVIYPLSFAVGGLIGEVYSYTYARFVMLLSAVFQAIFAAYAILTVSLKPAPFFHGKPEFSFVFNNEFRYILFAVLGIFLAEMLNVFLLIKWKIKIRSSGYLFRAIICALISQLLLSVVVNTGAFLGKTGSIGDLVWLSLSNYTVKMTFGIIYIVLCAKIILPFIRKYEKTFFVDIRAKFNPFSLTLRDPYREDKGVEE